MSPADPSRVDGRSRRYDAHRARLLAGATDYIVEHGVSSLSMRPLARALGVSHAALTNHFGSKERLIVEVLESFRQQSVAISAAKERHETLQHGFASYERWYATWTEDRYFPQMRLIFEVYGLAFREPQRYEQFLQHAITDWLEFLRPFLRAIGCPAPEIDDIATLMIAILHGLQVDLLTTGDRDRLDRAHAQFVHLLEARRAGWLAITAAD